MPKIKLIELPHRFKYSAPYDKEIIKIYKKQKLGIKRAEKRKKREAFDKIYSGLYLEVFNMYNFKCADCGGERHIGIHHIDKIHEHMVKENLILLCWACHSRKHHKKAK